jgi:RES domain-containing protein
MIAFRLLKQNYGSGLSGKGAEIAGGRWNSPGISIIYTSESRALCTAEVAVNLPLGNIPSGFEMISIFIPDDIVITEIREEDLPFGWKVFPLATITQKIGDEFIIQGKSLVMKVPSAVVPGDYNYLINPRHPDFSRIEIIKREPYEFDERFFKR